MAHMMATDTRTETELMLAAASQSRFAFIVKMTPMTGSGDIIVTAIAWRTSRGKGSRK